jgi:hypothetical protein
MPNRTQINFVVSSEQKSRWEEYVEENPNADNLSHLIRMSVESEINSESTETPTEEGISADSSEVLTALQRIENRIRDLDERLGVVERTTESEEDYDLQKAVYAVLPTADYEEKRGVSDMKHPREFGVTVDAVASELGADEQNVEEALENIYNFTSQVRKAGSGEGIFYWKVDE